MYKNDLDITHKNIIDLMEIPQKSDLLWQTLLSKIFYLSQPDQKVIRESFDMMIKCHGKQKRLNGDLYIVHPVQVCVTLAEMFLDVITLSTSLLYGSILYTQTKISELQRYFNSDTIDLISQINNLTAKLRQVKFNQNPKYTENFRKMFMASVKDLRVFLIKLVDRTHNLKSLHVFSTSHILQISQESLEIDAKIASRLGINHLKSDIEDIVFPHLFPSKYKFVMNNPHMNMHEKNKQLNMLIQKTEKFLIHENRSYQKVLGRVKSYYSVHQKMCIKNRPISEIKDLIALRVITYKKEDCYKVLNLLHKHFKQVEDTVDYIKSPKENGYSSIHTVVKDIDTNIVFEFQIRTSKMHEFAEFGPASHWCYKNKVNTKVREDWTLDTKNMHWIRDLIEHSFQKILGKAKKENTKINFFPDKIFVFTPKGDVVCLSEGSTVLDFANEINIDLCKNAVSSKINNHLAPLSQILEDGCIVEIVTC